MTVAVTFLIALAGLAAGDVDADDGSTRRRCDALRVIVAESPSIDGLTRGAALLPGERSVRVAAEAGRTDVDSAWRLLERATALTCSAADERRPRDALDDANLEQLATDPRFVGLRHDDDLSDQLLDRIGAWLERLLESDAMVAFSEQTRTIYLTGLAVVAVIVAWRIRRRRRPVHADADDIVAGRRDVARARAFQALRDEGAALVQSDPRAALLRLRQALLARLGEVDVDAARPARTASEIIARLAATSATTSTTVTPALRLFDERFYGGDVDVEAATILLGLVDDAAAVLAARGGR